MQSTRTFEQVEVGAAEPVVVEPLAGLRVSWGSILGGAVAIVAISMILFALAEAIALTATNASMASLMRTIGALGICAIVTTLIGAFAGGLLAGYLPGNGRLLIGGVHGFLAWAVAFVFASAVALGVLGGIGRTTTQLTTTAAQTAGSTMGGLAGGAATLDQKAQGILDWLGYTPSESATIIEQGKIDIRRELRTGGPTRHDARGAINEVIDWTAGLSWAWFGTWFVAALLALGGGILGARRLPRWPAGRVRPIPVPPVVVAPQPAPT
jgi:hypothetical protein